MVIYSSMLIRNCRELLSDNEHILKTTSQVEKFSRDLQDIGMSMRLDPIKGLFQKMSRLVWDVSKKLGKDVAFHMSGEDTELDRTVIEKLADPLMHMVRNSIDHGIEMPNDREALGKPRTGTVSLSASHVGGNILIQISDDGRGLDPKKLLKKAIEKGIVSEQDKLSEQDILNLVLAPGFSTAEKVTDISGRGVGMDVARNNIESMRGRIRISSEVGKGSTFSIELPLTLAIVDGIEVNVGSERFIIPTLSVIELINPTPEMITTTVGKGESFIFRSSFLPLYRLSVLYDIKPKHSNLEDVVVVVVENSGEKFALMVDDIIGSCQTVIKNLGEMFEENKGLAGCSIMPDGEIGLILDVRSLAQIARQEYSWETVKALGQGNEVFFPLEEGQESLLPLEEIGELETDPGEKDYGLAEVQE
jgi:two-component system chemotaxis sensor kinase CheA